MLYGCSLICTHTYSETTAGWWWLLESPALCRTHFRKKQYCSKYWEKPVHPRGWLQRWAFRCNVPSRHIIIPCAASFITWPVPWSSGLRVGTVQTLAAFPLRPVLLHACRMDVTCPFLPCLGKQGAQGWHFVLCFLLPAGILQVAGKQ